MLPRPKGSISASRDRRSRFRRFVFVATLLFLSNTGNATPLLTLDEQATTLLDHILKPDTLVLIVSDPEELPLAQQILTQAFSHDQPALILLQLPDNNPNETLFRRAAKRFFTSEFSRARVFLLKAGDNPYPDSKTLLLSPDSPTPLFRSPRLTGSSDLGRDHSAPPANDTP